MAEQKDMGKLTSLQLRQEKNSLSTQEPFKRILMFIKEGAENFVSLRDLISLTGLKDRELRRCIEEMRRSGIVIISGQNGGYYFPQDAGELSRYINRESKRARSLFYTLKTARLLYKKLSITGNEITTCVVRPASSK